MTIVEFLLARIAEDESVARYALSRDDGGALDYGGQWFGAVEHARRWEPTRVLAECEAKRRTLGQHPHELNADDTVRRCSTCGTPGRCLTVRHLAAVYADHPDYQEEWRPT